MIKTVASLKNLTGGQLEKMLVNTKAEIERRENIKSAVAEISAVLKKYKISIDDIDLQAFNKKASRKTSQRGKVKVDAPDKRKRVKAKYANPNGTETWSGRGRAPAWVMALCETEGIELASFKMDKRFIQS